MLAITFMKNLNYKQLKTKHIMKSKRYILKFKTLYVFTTSEKGQSFINSHSLAHEFTKNQAEKLVKESDIDLKILEV